MQISYLAIPLFAAVAAAQNSTSLPDLVAQLPTCAADCLSEGASNANCTVTDFSCICENKDSFLSGAATCVITSSCTSEERNSTSSPSRLQSIAKMRRSCLNFWIFLLTCYLCRPHFPRNRHLPGRRRRRFKLGPCLCICRRHIRSCHGHLGRTGRDGHPHGRHGRDGCRRIRSFRLVKRPGHEQRSQHARRSYSSPRRNPHDCIHDST